MMKIHRKFGRCLPAPFRLAGLAGLTSAALLMSVPGASSAGAQNRDVDLFYKVYIGGFHVVDLTVDIGLASAAYDIEARIQTTGMIGRMFPWWMKAYSRGAVATDRLTPETAGQRNSWKGKERYIELRFEGATPRIERIKPKPDNDDRRFVPEALRAGSIDLASAILTVITRMENGARCDTQVPVFDGRRRYDLVLEPDGTDELRANRFSPYAGPTVNCLVSIDKKAGFKQRDESGINDNEAKAQVWMGRAFNDTPPVPVRLTYDTPFGALIAHLNRATLDAGGEQRALSHADAGKPPRSARFP